MYESSNHAVVTISSINSNLCRASLKGGAGEWSWVKALVWDSGDLSSNRGPATATLSALRHVISPLSSLSVKGGYSGSLWLFCPLRMKALWDGGLSFCVFVQHQALGAPDLGWGL